MIKAMLPLVPESSRQTTNELGKWLRGSHLWWGYACFLGRWACEIICRAGEEKSRLRGGRMC